MFGFDTLILSLRIARKSSYMNRTFSLIHFRSLSLITLLSLFAFACKKKDAGGQNGGLTDADSLKYLMYQLMQKTIVDGGRDQTTTLPLYYWYKKVPEMNPLSGEFPSAEALLQRMKSHVTDPAGRIMDRYSYLDDGSMVGEIEGVAGDIGIEALFARLSESDIRPVVTAVDKNSPAGTQGVKRGWIIKSVNNKSTQYDGQNGPNVQRLINALYYDATATFEFVAPDGSPVNLTLAKAEYALNPILFDTVFSVGTKNVGYFVLNSFPITTTQNGSATITKTEIDRVFNAFTGKNISSLIVDLRYNGGGEPRTTQYIANKIAPASANGKVMYKTLYNDHLDAYFASMGDDNRTFFAGGGNLNLESVMFISSERTASASELLYNVLRPYMNVKLIGDTTYGKPVGAFVLPVTIYKSGVETLLSYLLVTTFETKNANNEGGYYYGLPPDVRAFDYIDLPWGSDEDDNLKKAFKFVKDGSFERLSPEFLIPDPSMAYPVPQKTPGLRHHDLIDYRRSKEFSNMK